MTGFVVLLRRELRRRLLPIATGAALGLFVAIVPWLPGMGRHDPAELRAAAGLGLGLLWGLALALAEGSGFLARDLGEHRIAFDFRLPASGTAIWAAHGLGALLGVVVGTALVVAPSLLAGADLGSAAEGARLTISQSLIVDLPPMIVTATAALALVGALAHLFGFGRATRSPWVAVDLLVGLALVALGLRALAPLDQWGARQELGRQLVAFALLAAAATGAASWTQLLRGRSEPDRAHRPFALALAPLALLSALALVARSDWYLSPRPNDLPLTQEQPARLSTGVHRGFILDTKAVGSRWTQISGYADGREPILFRFLSESGQGRTLRLGPQSGLWRFATWPALSADGSTLAWLEAGRERGELGPARLVWIDPRRPGQLQPTASLAWPYTPVAWGLAPDGRRIATYWPLESPEAGARRLLVEDRDDHRVLVAARLAGCPAAGPLRFLDDRTVRVLCSSDRVSIDDPLVREACDLDVGTGLVTRRPLSIHSQAELERALGVE